MQYNANAATSISNISAYDGIAKTLSHSADHNHTTITTTKQYNISEQN